MRLTQIKLAGFKSFVDPTTLSLASNLTSVVGPNGCGKSNVIDAVRWVTGESSARQLRGESLEDVIFNGSNARKPVGRASVELKFDNGEGKLGGQYGAFAEISVRRELTRDGGSKYFINNTRARRRDVVDLFLGTGLGGRSNYAVIEQGAVNRLIEAKPEDMRQVLEETAGISKYKERRRETENRMRHTRENLERLDDLISEITQRLATLKRQAANAEKYKTLKADERRLRAELLTLHWQARTGEVEAAEARLREAENRLREVISARRRADGARDEAGKAQQNAMTEVHNRQAAYYDAQARVGRIEQTLAHARDVERMRQRERQQLVDRLDTLGQRRQGDREADAKLAAEERTRQTERDAATAERDAARERLATAEQQAAQAESAWDECNASEHNPVQQLDAERTRARYTGQQREALAERDAARRAERERLPAIDDSGLAEAGQDVEARARQLEADREQAAAAGTANEALRGEIAELEQQLAARRTELAERQAELASERKMQQAVLREDDETINAWLAARGHGQAEGVARRVRIRDGWQDAAEAALGPLLRGFTVESLAGAAAEALEWPNEPVTLVESERDFTADRPAPPPGLVSLAEGIEGPAALRAAAAQIFVADDLDAALAARERLGACQSIITRQGCRVGAASLTTPAAESAERGVFEREQRIASLADEVTALEQQRAADDNTLSERRARFETRRREAAALDQKIGEAQRGLETLRAELEGRRLRAEQTRRRDGEIEAELRDLAAQHAQAAEQADAAAVRVRELETEAERFAVARQSARETLTEARKKRDSARSEAATAERRLGELDKALAQIASRREHMTSRLADTTAGLDDVTRRLEGFDAETPDMAASCEYSADDLGAARETQAGAERELRAARAALTACESELEKQAQAAMGAEQDVESAREVLQQAKVEIETAGVRRQGVVERLAELGEAPADIAKTLPEDATADAWNESIETIERRIARLGAINLAAIEEYDEVAEREQYLGAQRADLSEALATLEAAISRIDRETRQRFKSTYDQVNSRFSDMFPQLFGGGEAALELTDEDWLTTGVRVIARPPGKRNASIQMLSGGEKALTAVALLFALFELNPAPFCMLDEIDAPLDDANVSRFCELVRKMSAQVQFIVITHNKLTMELAEQLHGVTMAEPGVSRLVSVDIDQALGLAE
ncbi:chromosome segregation protein SMC [Salinisphaera sp.]|uniref:chromosome segregation protein SMC n=1 Tax=Salinisphaera sp. TaxID=1914330 RepID=UPI002D783745|nr:chromosome segregation protein SMC [Salinisphaera sp.]HET7313623.1 chromosome segregation protein SMC [Salinisphaera sp.]